MRQWTRREWLHATALGAAAGLSGCAARRPPALTPHARPLSRAPFARPRIDPRLVIRSIVGLRPFRASGFVVRAERIGDTLLVHNYGHGGGGITLSWGSSALAVREAATTDARRAAVIGAGVMGLTTARLLQDRGWQVTVYAQSLPPHTTSNVAGGQWSPTSVFDEMRATPVFEAQFKEAARLAHHAFSSLTGGAYGVSWKENYHLNLKPSPIARTYYLRELPELFPSLAELGPDEHPFPVPHVTRYVTMLVEPAVFLRRLMTDVREAGGSFVVREFRDRSEVFALSDPVIVNCTGLGAAALFGDEELEPVRGQLVFLPPDDRVDYLTIGGGRGLLYMFPRQDGLLLGGTYERGATHLTADPETTDRIVGEHARIAAAMRV
jgi:glycine/D-amino acid oxidase-like deaminating enzyme